MVLAPHPDDESLGCGGAIAAAEAIGRRVVVVVLTDGTGSHPNSRSYPAARLAALRERELRKAVVRLTSGKGAVFPLRYPDQGIPDTAADRLKIVRQLIDIVDGQNAGAIWTTWEGDPHPDHQMAASLARQAVSIRHHLALWRFPVWGRFTRQAPTTKDRLVRFDTAPYRRIKAAAVAAHRSQMTRLISDDPRGFVMAPETRRHFLSSPEYFLSEDPNV